MNILRIICSIILWISAIIMVVMKGDYTEIMVTLILLNLITKDIE